MGPSIQTRYHSIYYRFEEKSKSFWRPMILIEIFDIKLDRSFWDYIRSKFSRLHLIEEHISFDIQQNFRIGFENMINWLKLQIRLIVICMQYLQNSVTNSRQSSPILPLLLRKLQLNCTPIDSQLIPLKKVFVANDRDTQFVENK